MSTVSPADDQRLRLSAEGRLARWVILGCTWLFVAAFALADTLAVRDYVRLLDDSATLPAEQLAMRRTLPAPYADAQQWTRLALEHAGGYQVRYTKLDNAPQGREVHWNSAFVHLVRVAGQMRVSMTNEPLPQATENALAWFNLPLFLAVVVFFSSWVARRSGAAAGVLVALGMAGHRWFYDGFAPNYVDHHGLLSASVFGLVLGAMYMGAGWHGDDRRGERNAALLSAICGGVGLWISAASTIPEIALVGAAGVVAAWWSGDDDDAGITFDGDLWRLWGRVGGAISLVAYLAEYAPHHFGMRLEVNHPLYALAWIGGGELVATLGEWRARRERRPLWRTALATIAVAAPAVVIVIWRAAVFLPLDPPLARLHHAINEFTPLSAFIQKFGVGYAGRYLLALVLVLPLLLAFQRRQPARRALLLAGIVSLALTVMGLVQVRWFLPAGAAELCLVLAAVAAIAHRVSRRAALLSIGVLGAVFAEQAAWRVMVTRRNVVNHAVTPADALQPMFRDAAVALRASQPSGDVVLLASPDASTAIGYFGGFRTLGTFYWENRDGLLAAAKILSAESDDEARALIAARGVTHIALFSASNFLDPYLAAARGSSSMDALKRTFGYRLLADGKFPRWLRAIPFPMRTGGPSAVSRLLEVVPDQSELESLWASAIAKAVNGESTAMDDFRSAIALQPAARRAELFADAGRDVYRWREQRLALALYRESAALAPSRQTTLAIAWLLATSVDDAVRDGANAVAMIEPLARSAPDYPGVLDTYAAALAEAGRFDDAVRTETAAIANAERAGDDDARARGSLRLAAYRAGRPWRQ